MQVRSFVHDLAPVFRNSRELSGPEMPVVKLQSTCFEKLMFFAWKTKRIAKFDGLEPRRYEDTKGIVAPEIDPKSFGTSEKQSTGQEESTDNGGIEPYTSWSALLYIKAFWNISIISLWNSLVVRIVWKHKKTWLNLPHKPVTYSLCIRWLKQIEARLKELECRLHKHTTEGYFSLHFFAIQITHQEPYAKTTASRMLGSCISNAKKTISARADIRIWSPE